MSFFTTLRTDIPVLPTDDEEGDSNDDNDVDDDDDDEDDDYSTEEENSALVEPTLKYLMAVKMSTRSCPMELFR